jgi:hypothetical protein
MLMWKKMAGNLTDQVREIAEVVSHISFVVGIY